MADISGVNNSSSKQVIDLCSKYRPKSLKDLYGQERVASFFRSVMRRPEEAPRYYLIQGPFGTGKTSLVRAFAHDFIGEGFMSTPNYMEIDSSERRVSEDFDVMKEFIFQQVRGWKVVVIDEAHLLSPSASQRLLKVFEDFIGSIFIFLCTTNPELMFPPLLSRLHSFSLSLFTPEQCIEYAKQVLAREGLSISDRALSVAALNSQGHLRTVVKQCELILFQGEEYYLSSVSTVWSLLEDYFFSDADTADLVQRMYSFHPSELRSYFSYYFRDQVLNPKGKHGGEWPAATALKIYAKYLQLTAYMREAEDFFSFLYCFRPVVDAARAQSKAKR